MRRESQLLFLDRPDYHLSTKYHVTMAYLRCCQRFNLLSSSNVKTSSFSFSVFRRLCLVNMSSYVAGEGRHAPDPSQRPQPRHDDRNGRMYEDHASRSRSRSRSPAHALSGSQDGRYESPGGTHSLPHGNIFNLAHARGGTSGSNLFCKKNKIKINCDWRLSLY